MSIDMGPVLGFRGQDQDGWHVCVLVVTEDATTPARPTITWSITEADGAEAGEGRADQPARLKSLAGKTVWRFPLSIEQGEWQRVVEYTIEGETNSFVVPARKSEDPIKARHQPLRVAYASCNGLSNYKDVKKLGTYNAMWEVLRRQHEEPVYWEGMGRERRPYHLLVLGGDQLYADAIWGRLPSLKRWGDMSNKERAGEPRDEGTRAALEREAEEFYFELYCEQWKRPEMKRMLARIPTLMMWDDHDIFDGWGSYPADQQQWGIYRAIFAAAREHFCLFQLQATLGELEEARAKFREGGWEGRFGGDSRELPALIPGQEAFSYAYRVDDAVFAALDMRSERSLREVMSDASREAFYGWLDKLEKEKSRNFILLSAIPVVYVNSAMLGRLLRWAPWQDDPEFSYSLNDDFADQWMSDSHRFERLRLINRLLDFSERKECRVTVVSGDVHVGGVGKIEASVGGAPARDAWTINQLISSPIVHLPNSGLLVSLMEWRLDGAVEHLDHAGRDITARMIKLPTTGYHLIAARNWLSLTLDYKGRVWAEWFIEEMRPANPAEPYTKLSQVIYPVHYFESDAP